MLKFYRIILFSMLFAVPLIFLPIVNEQFEAPKLYIIWLSCAALLGAVSFKGLKYDRIGIALLAFLASTIVSVFGSLSPQMSVFGFSQCPNGVMATLGYVTIYFAAKSLLGGSKEILAAFKIMTYAGMIVFAYGIVQYFGFDLIHWKGELDRYTVLRPASTMGHPNFMAAFAVMLLPLTTLLKSKWIKRLAITLTLTVICLTQSRGAWLACGAMALLWLYFNGVKKSFLAWCVAIGAILPSVSAFIDRNFVNRDHFPLLHSLLDRFASLLSLNGARLEYVKSAFKIFTEHPFFGSGTDTFRLAFEHNRTAAYWIMEPAGAPHRAHNELMNIAATQGAFGIACTIGLITFVAIKLSRTFPLRNTLSFTVLAYAITSFVGFPVAVTNVVFIIALAAITNLSDGRESYV